MKNWTTILALTTLTLAGIALVNQTETTAEPATPEFLNLPEWMTDGPALYCDGEQYSSRQECWTYCDCGGCFKRCDRTGCCTCICP